MTEPKNILIVRTDRIGDVVLTLPMISILKKHLPECRITFMVREYTKPIVEMNNLIDEIFVYNEKISFAETVIALRQKSFDTCFVVHPKFRLALLLFLSKIKNRIGTGYRWYSFLFNRRIYDHRKFGVNHELHHNINLLKQIGIDEKITTENVSFNLQPTENSERIVREKLDKLNLDNQLPIIVIHPGSGGSAVDLPVSHFKQVVNTLAHELKINILLTGSLNEKETCEKIMTDKNTYNSAGMFNLEELAAVINKSELLMANSTGPIHIAAALGKNVIGFYPKIASCSVTRWGPYTDKKIIFSPTIGCSGCTREQCARLNCMSSIDVNEIVNSVRHILNNRVN